MKGTFVGYDRDSPAYLVYFHETGVVKKVRNVKFQNVHSDSDLCQQQTPTFHDTYEEEDSVSLQDKQNVPRNIENENMNMNEPVQGTRTRGRPKHLENFYVDNEVDEHLNVTLHYVYGMNLDVPTTYNEAINSKDADEWKLAMNNEMRALEENDTFELTTLPPDRKVVGGRWVYAIKTGLNDVKEFKARYVAKGYSQIPEIDYSETFSPTARMTSIRLLMQLAVQNDMFIHQMDVKSAYLNAPIEREIYVEQPSGFEIKGDKEGKLVFKLKKSLYGLKQSGRNWNQTLNVHLDDLGLLQSLNDPCIYTKQLDHDKDLIILLTFVGYDRDGPSYLVYLPETR